MPTTLAPAPAEVKPAATRSGFTITSWPAVEFHPERDILDTEAASFAAWRADEDADADMWDDDHADELAGLALAESRIESGLMAW